MKFSTKLILGLSTLAGLVGVYHLDNYFTQRYEEKKAELAKALYFKPEEVVKFSLTNKIGKFVFERESGNSQWKMLEPKKVNADINILNNTLNALSQINVQNELANTGKLIKKGGKTALAEYGLDAPKLSMSVTLANNKTGTLELGNSVSIGSSQSGVQDSISIYARNLSRRNIFVMSSSTVNSFATKNYSDFRTKGVADFRKVDVQKITIQSTAVNLTLEKKNNKWGFTAPYVYDADDEFIQTFLQMYKSLQAVKVIEKEVVEHDGLEKYDLLNPAAKVQFLNENGTLVQEFNLGITKEAVFIKMLDGSVAQFSLSTWPDAIPLEKKFKNKQVFFGEKTDEFSAFQVKNVVNYVRKNSSWFKKANITDVVTSDKDASIDALTFFTNFEYMTADDVLFNVLESDLSKYGLTDKTRKITFYYSKESNKTPVDIFIGNKVMLNKKGVYIKRSDSPLVFIVQDDWLAQLEKL